MAIVTDPDDLRRSTNASGAAPTGELYINPTVSPPIIEIISTDDDTGGTVSNIDPADGVTLQAIYSKLKELWKSEADLIKYKFPMEAITSEQYEFINDWELSDATTASRTYVRTAGWAEKDASGVTKQEYMNVTTLGTFNSPSTQKAYYYWAGDSSETNFTYFGPVNEAVKIYGDATHGNFDNRSTVLTVAIRPDTTGASGSVEGYTYDQSTTTDIGASTVTYQAYRFPLSSTIDLKLTLTNTEITDMITAKGVSLKWTTGAAYSSGTYLSIDLNNGPYSFDILLDSTTNNLTPSDAYNILQYKLRTAGDIDEETGSSYGYLTEALAVFVGDTLETYCTNGNTQGVLIGGIDNNYTSNFKMRDNSNVLQVFPTVSSGSITVNTNLIEDAAGKYFMFFNDAGGNVYPGANAIIVNKYDGITPISGDVHYQAASPTTGPNSDDDTGGAVASGSAAGTTVTMTGITAWTADDTNIEGHVLVIETGLNAGYYWITNNTTDTLTISPALENTDASMSWEIRTKNGTGVIPWDFDYTNNTQGGRTGDADAAVSIVAIGLRTGQYVLATGNSIVAGAGQNFSVTSALERNYSDPN